MSKCLNKTTGTVSVMPEQAKYWSGTEVVPIKYIKPISQDAVVKNTNNIFFSSAGSSALSILTEQPIDIVQGQHIKIRIDGLMQTQGQISPVILLGISENASASSGSDYVDKIEMNPTATATDTIVDYVASHTGSYHIVMLGYHTTGYYGALWLE